VTTGLVGRRNKLGIPTKGGIPNNLTAELLNKSAASRLVKQMKSLKSGIGATTLGGTQIGGAAPIGGAAAIGGAAIGSPAIGDQQKVPTGKFSMGMNTASSFNTGTAGRRAALANSFASLQAGGGAGAITGGNLVVAQKHMLNKQKQSSHWKAWAAKQRLDRKLQ
jgi:hypothetical protein